MVGRLFFAFSSSSSSLLQPLEYKRREIIYDGRASKGDAAPARRLCVCVCAVYFMVETLEVELLAPAPSHGYYCSPSNSQKLWRCVCTKTDLAARFFFLSFILLAHVI